MTVEKGGREIKVRKELRRKERKREITCKDTSTTYIRVQEASFSSAYKQTIIKE
jgi:hypothetical protein